MRLTQFSDYTLRVLLYLAAHQDRCVSVKEISEAYGVSSHHLVKVVRGLVERGLVVTVRGRHGGLRLGAEPGHINVGQVVRFSERTFDLVECFDHHTNTCPIDAACGLKSVLQGAYRAFMGVLDEHTLADFLPHRDKLIRLWKAPPASMLPAKVRT